jgi:hypothetical protein
MNNDVKNNPESISRKGEWEMMNELSGVQEYRDIKITSKRQLTIPKSFFDALNMEDEVQAYLLEDGIFLKPIRSVETVYERDIEMIVQKAIKEGFTGQTLAKEISQRISRYDRALADRVHEFVDDMKADSGAEEEGEVDFNGLDVFIDEENGKAPEIN